MEKSQKEHIRKNLPALVEATDCSVTLLNILQSSGHLSTEDVENINEQNGTLKKANTLYQILQKRKGAYKDLIIAFRDTNQSKAQSILLENCQANYISENSNDLITEGIVNISFDCNAILGEGRRGTFVLKGGFLKERKVAIKKMDLDYHDRKIIRNEIRLLKKLDGFEQFLRVFGIESSNNCIFIAYELCEFSLRQWVFMKERQTPKLDVLYQITSGLAYLHAQKIIHNNLSPDNILLKYINNTTVRAKIIGFGLSKELPVTEFQCGNKKAVLKGSDMWTAPEILKYYCTESVDYVLLLSSLDLQSDIFSLGCIYYYLLTNGIHPFGDLIRGPGNILDGKSSIKPTEIKEGFPHYHWLIQLMISGNVSSRTCASSLLATPIFWCNQKVSNFIAALIFIRRIRNSATSLEDTWFKVDQWALEAGIISKTTNSWLPHLCETMQFHASSSNYNKSSIKGLLIFIVDVVNGAFSDSVSSLVDPWITYFISRFRYLVTILWISFQEHKGEQTLSAYYSEFNDCNMDEVKGFISSHLDYTPPDIPVVFTPLIRTNSDKSISRENSETSRFLFNLKQDFAATCLDQSKGSVNTVVSSSNLDGKISTHENDNGIPSHSHKRGHASYSFQHFSASYTPKPHNHKMNDSFEIPEFQNTNCIVDKTPEETHFEDEDFEIVSENDGELDPPENKEITQPPRKSSLLKLPKAAYKYVKNSLGIGCSEKKTMVKKSDIQEKAAASNRNEMDQKKICRMALNGMSAVQNSAVENISNNCHMQMSQLSISTENKLLNINVTQFANIDQKIYLRWVNFNLKLENIEISDFCNDFQDGTVFLKLVSKLSGESCGEPNKTRKSKFSMKEHFRRGVQFLMKKRRFKAFKTDLLVDGNDVEKEMEKLLWELMLTFHLQELQAMCDSRNPSYAALRNALLSWIQERIRGYPNVKVTDFSESWKNGLPLCALVHSCFPDLFDYDQLTAGDSQNNLQIALGVAEREFGIPCLFDPIDFPILTERAVISQVTYFFRQFTKSNSEFSLSHRAKKFG